LRLIPLVVTSTAKARIAPTASRKIDTPYFHARPVRDDEYQGD